MVPISGSQDSPGPMTQTVSEAALLLSVMTGRSEFMDALVESRKVKIGVVKSWLTKHEGTNQLFESALDKLRESGFELIEIDLPTPSSDVFPDEFSVMKHELFSDLGTYLEGRSGTRVKTLSDVVEFNKRHQDTELRYFDQNIFEQALILGGRNTAYSEVRKRNLEWAENLLNEGLANVDVLIGCSFATACESRLGEGDDFSNVSWITRAPSIAGTPIGSLPMGVTGGLPTGMGLVVNRHQDALLVKAMSQIEKALNIGILVPTFIKDQIDKPIGGKVSDRAKHSYLPAE
jgi:amidase